MVNGRTTSSFLWSLQKASHKALTISKRNILHSQNTFTWKIKSLNVLLVGWPVSFYKLFLMTLSPKDLLFYLFSYFVLVWVFFKASMTESLGSPLTLHAIWISYVGYPKDWSAKSRALLNLLCDFCNSEKPHRGIKERTLWTRKICFYCNGVLPVKNAGVHILLNIQWEIERFS